MCQMNIDAYQGEMNRHFKTSYHMPILFFTQLMGVAFGSAPEDVGFGTEIVSARRLLEKIGVPMPPADVPPGGVGAGPEPAARRPRAKRGPTLPMPRMPREWEAVQ
jgi:heterodisulfide reductase subunit B